MRRVLVVILLVGLVVTGSALAARGEPKKRITPEDQARAKAMLLKPADMPGYAATPPGGEAPTPYCAALDESDLTLTGDAESADYTAGTTVVSSFAQVYSTRAHADASWRRGTSRAGQKCALTVVRKELAREGVRLESFGSVAFPSLAQGTIAYRAVASNGGVRIVVDVVTLRRGRAHAALAFGSAVIPFDRKAQVRLARLVDARMASAMRGG